MTLQKLLVDLRGDMTLKEASEKIGISLGYLRNLETGKRQKPSIDTLKKISEAYNCSLDELLSLAGGVLEDQEKEVIEEYDSNPLEFVISESVKVVFEEDVFDVEMLENGDIRLSGPPKRYEVVNRFFDIGYILKYRERALYNGHQLTEEERRRAMEMLKLLFPQYSMGD